MMVSPGMKTCFKHLILIVLFLMIASLNGVVTAQDLKEEWYGRYKGPLQIWQGGTIVQELSMEFEFKPIVVDSNWTWVIIYEKDGQTDRREYELVRTDIVGRYQIDEKNGIILDADLNDRVLFSRFDLGGTWIIATYRFGIDNLEFEIFSGTGAPSRLTGGISGLIPEVAVFPLATYQKGLLDKLEMSK